jgi:homocitrate synthase NifV
MALFLGNNRVLNIIDRTLPEIYENKGSIKEHDLINYCNMMRNIGVSLFEVDLKFIKRVGKLPEGINFICRLKSEYEAEECISRGIGHCVVKWMKLQNPYFYDTVTKCNLKVTAEFEAGLSSDIYKLKRLLKSGRIRSTESVRITGLDRVTSDFWVSTAKKLEREFKLKIDVCPANSYNIATSVAVEAVLGGLDTITLSFMGYGKSKGFAAIEEVLMAIKLLVELKENLDLTILPELSEVFTGVSGIPVSGNKPVVGNDIFKYESGIHADGIEKNPATYEPFNPNEVGQERKLVIGKHSGKKSVGKKLKEFGQELDETEVISVLEQVRAKSIEMKRELCDCEIKDILYSCKAV